MAFEHLSSSGDHSYLFFADDLIIFYKADMKHDRLLKKILHIFCEISKDKINLRKIKIFFSKRVKESTTLALNNLLGF